MGLGRRSQAIFLPPPDPGVPGASDLLGASSAESEDPHSPECPEGPTPAWPAVSSCCGLWCCQQADLGHHPWSEVRELQPLVWQELVLSLFRGRAGGCRSRIPRPLCDPFVLPGGGRGRGLCAGVQFSLKKVTAADDILSPLGWVVSPPPPLTEQETGSLFCSRLPS